MEGGLLLDVVIGEGAAILELLSGEDQTLLIGRNTFLVLDLGPIIREKHHGLALCSGEIWSG